MKSLIIIHILLLVLGLIMGFFAVYDSADLQSQWISLIYQLALTAISVSVFFGCLIFATRSTHVKTLFWLNYLAAFFGSALGLGLILQSIFYNQLYPSFFIPFVTSIGYFVALVGAYKLQKWRHSETF